ncbi:MAG TPA: hypothetical protein VJT31_09790 [Rugosimonospora sp.]|nr:hypothetical protein [Rugosimonospora sp.]
MTIKKWLAGAAILAAAALPAASGVVANDLGPDNTQSKHTSTAVLAGDPDDGGQVAVLAGGDPPVITHVVLADAPRDPASGLPTGKRQVTSVLAHPDQAEPPIVRD